MGYGRGRRLGSLSTGLATSADFVFRNFRVQKEKDTRLPCSFEPPLLSEAALPEKGRLVWLDHCRVRTEDFVRVWGRDLPDYSDGLLGGVDFDS
jgi:hypothetical protein